MIRLQIKTASYPLSASASLWQVTPSKLIENDQLKSDRFTPKIFFLSGKLTTQ
jgi:hypothetical protein